MTYRPLPVRLSSVVRASVKRIRMRQATFVVLALVASFFAAQVARAEPPAIAAKRAEAQRVLGEIHSLDVQLEKAIEAYNSATDELAAIERESNLNAQHLVIAKHNLYVSRRRLGARLRALYTGEEPFIHALDTEHLTAACIDLDGVGAEDAGSARLTLSGGTLKVGTLATVDTRTLKVSTPASTTLQTTRESHERSIIQKALRECGYRRGEAARILGISRVALWKKMKRLGIDAVHYSPN